MTAHKSYSAITEPESGAAVNPVAAVIVTWNGAAEIEACLDACSAARPAEIVVVDNGSKDDTCELVKVHLSHPRLMSLPKNVGFAAGCNLGINNTKAPFVLMLNSDARLNPNYLEILIEVLEKRPELGSAVGKLVYMKSRQRYIDSAGIKMRRYALSAEDLGLGQKDTGQFDHPEDIFGPSAAAAVYRRKALEDVGPEIFDERLFAYYEDLDLAWRLNRRGWRHAFVPTAIAWHKRRGPGGGKPNEITARAFVNRYLVFAKNESPGLWLMYGTLALAWEAARIARRFWSDKAQLKDVGLGVRQALETIWERVMNFWR